MRVRIALLLVLAALACRREPEPPPQTATVAQPAAPAEVNLLDLLRGASIVSRTGEYWYETSAAHTIDHEEASNWVSPPGGPQQTIVVSLPARSRIRKLGLSKHPGGPHRLRVESSLDGSSWTVVTTLDIDPDNVEPQIRDVAPFEALYLRLHTMAPGQNFSVIRELYAHGDELAPPHAASIEGCWTINGRGARFTRRGAEVQGVIDASDREKAVHLDGGFDGRAYRFMWRGGAQIGDAVLTVSPDGRAISGVSRHKGAGTELTGDGWLGTRGPCATASIAAGSVRARVLEVIRRYPVYALRFDDQDRLLADDSAAALDRIAAMKNIRLVARGRATRLASLRDALASRGDITGYEFVDGTAAQATVKPTFYGPNIEIELR